MSIGRSFPNLITTILAVCTLMTASSYAQALENGLGSRGGGGGVFLTTGKLKFISLITEADKKMIVDRDVYSLRGFDRQCHAFESKRFQFTPADQSLLNQKLNEISKQYPRLGNYLRTSIANIVAESVLVPISLDPDHSSSMQVVYSLLTSYYFFDLMAQAAHNLPGRNISPEEFGGQHGAQQRNFLDWTGWASQFDGGYWPELRLPFHAIPVSQQHTAVFFLGSITYVSAPLINAMDSESRVAVFLHEGLRSIFDHEIYRLPDHATLPTETVYLEALRKSVPLLMNLPNPNAKAALDRTLPTRWMDLSDGLLWSPTEELDWRFIRWYNNLRALSLSQPELMNQFCKSAQYFAY